MTDQKPVRLIYRGRPCGPSFRTAAEAQAFVAWLQARTGLEWWTQAPPALAALKRLWEQEAT